MGLAVVSHLINITVTGTLVFLFLSGSQGTDISYGLDAPARRILACVYAAIGLARLATLIILAVYGATPAFVNFSISLFAIQILYKCLTAVALGLGHPVVISNLVISAVHAASIFALWRMANT